MKKYKKTALTAALALFFCSGMPGASAIPAPPKAQPSAINEQLIKTYKKNTSDYNVIEALELLKDTTGEY